MRGRGRSSKAPRPRLARKLQGGNGQEEEEEVIAFEGTRMHSGNIMGLHSGTLTPSGPQPRICTPVRCGSSKCPAGLHQTPPLYLYSGTMRFLPRPSCSASSSAVWYELWVMEGHSQQLPSSHAPAARSAGRISRTTWGAERRAGG